MIDLWDLSTGDVIVTADGSRGRVKTPTRDGVWVLVEYLVSDDGTVGGDDLVSREEIIAVESAPPAGGGVQHAS